MPQAKRLKDLEQENGRLKRVVADLTLEDRHYWSGPSRSMLLTEVALD